MPTRNSSARPGRYRSDRGGRSSTPRHGLEKLKTIRREISVQQADEGDRLRAFGQEREVVEIREQDGRRTRVFRLYPAGSFQFVGDGRRQDVVEQLFSARPFGWRLQAAPDRAA